ncbi:MAG: DsbE family thiol:disulfide interchange protein [Methyloligellaceae bacterium]
MTETQAEAEVSSTSKWSVAIPLLVFLSISGVFLYALTSLQPSSLNSALIGKSVPEFTLPPVEGVEVPGFSQTELKQGKVSVVNVWASWCAPCKEEHKHLVTLARDAKVPLFGINQKDLSANARGFLKEHGNPYSYVGADSKGRVSITWGVYGIPETFVVDRNGKIAYRHVGPIDTRIINEELIPLINKLRTQ